MTKAEITEKDRERARNCLECPVCNYARKKQKGIVFWFIKTVESRICPYGKAYEKVYSRKSHEPLPTAGQG